MAATRGGSGEKYRVAAAAAASIIGISSESGGEGNIARQRGAQPSKSGRSVTAESEKQRARRLARRVSGISAAAASRNRAQQSRHGAWRISGGENKPAKAKKATYGGAMRERRAAISEKARR